MIVAVEYSDSVQRGLDQLGTWVPKLIGALVILAIGFVIAKVVSAIARRGLEAVGADRALERGQAGQYKQRLAPNTHPSGIVGKIVFWFLFGMAILAAVSALGVAALSDFVSSVVAYLPNIVAALLILLVAVAVAGAVGAPAERMAGGTLLGRIVKTVVPALVMTIAMFMALVQLKIATPIVTATYWLVLGGMSAAFALAFGLGGRDVARQILQSQYDAAQGVAPRMKAEAEQARQRAAQDAQALRQQAQAAADSPAPQPGARTNPR